MLVALALTLVAAGRRQKILVGSLTCRGERGAIRGRRMPPWVGASCLYGGTRLA